MDTHERSALADDDNPMRSSSCETFRSRWPPATRRWRCTSSSSRQKPRAPDFDVQGLDPKDIDRDAPMEEVFV